MDEIMEIIYDCCEEVDQSSIKLDSRIMEDLELSSLEFFSMISELEAEYEIKITEREIQSFVTIGDIVQVVMQKAGL